MARTINLGRVKGTDGTNATINGLEAITIDTTNGIEGTQEGSTFTLEVDDTVARVNELPTKVSDLINDSNFQNDTQVANVVGVETTNRQNAVNNLQSQIDAITSASDVVDVVGTYEELEDYDTSDLKDNDIVKVLVDETKQNAISYYRWGITAQTWTYIGSQGPFYTKSESDALLNDKQNKIDNNLQTVSKNIVGAINEVNSMVGNAESLMADLYNGGGAE